MASALMCIPNDELSVSVLQRIIRRLQDVYYSPV